MVKINLAEVKLQKNRFCKKPRDRNLNYGDVGFLVKKEGRLELIQLFLLKKFLKKLFLNRKKEKEKNKKIAPKLDKIWFNIKPNFIIQRKSKNSRMGKGKGSFERKIIKIYPGDILIQFFGFNVRKLKLILIKLNKKLDIRLALVCKKYSVYPLWFKLNKYAYFYEKYF